MVKIKIKEEGVMVSFSVGGNKNIVVGGKNKEVEVSEEVFETIKSQVEQWEKYIVVEQVNEKKESDVVGSEVGVQEGSKVVDKSSKRKGK